tara:strand:+ start:4996 stop:5277 length:282 start_codon:yes stop_codon:yes gene_type:complete
MKNIEIIKSSILEINKQLKNKNKIIFKKNFEILGPKSNLDSLVIVNFFIAIEDKIKAAKGKEINLFREDFFEKGFKKSYTIADLENHLNKKFK